MLETAVLVMSILALVLSLVAFAASAVVAVIVIGWKNSTHKVTYLPAPETRYEVDLPPEVAAQAPSSPEPVTPEQYARKLREQSLEDLYEPSF